MWVNLVSLFWDSVSLLETIAGLIISVGSGHTFQSCSLRALEQPSGSHQSLPSSVWTFVKNIFIYLAVPGLSFSMQDLVP